MASASDIVLAIYERQPKVRSASELYNDIWDNLTLFYEHGHLNTTVLMIFPDTIDTVNLQASHLSPSFAADVATAIQHFRLERPDMEGFALIHEIQIETNQQGAQQLFVSDVGNGVALFFRHRDVPVMQIRVAFAQLGGKELVLYEPHELTDFPEDGIVAALSFDLNFLQQ